MTNAYFSKAGAETNFIQMNLPSPAWELISIQWVIRLHMVSLLWNSHTVFITSKWGVNFKGTAWKKLYGAKLIADLFGAFNAHFVTHFVTVTKLLAIGFGHSANSISRELIKIFHQYSVDEVETQAIQVNVAVTSFSILWSVYCNLQKSHFFIFS